MKKKILFLDLDGTLLNDAKQITQGNRDALRKALAAGHKVVIATGRAMASAVKQNLLLGLTCPGCYIIAYNGGMILDSHTGQIIFQKLLPGDLALQIMQLGREQNVHIQTYDEDSVVLESWAVNEKLEHYCNGSKLPYRVAEDLTEELKRDVPKVLAIDLHDRQPMEVLSEAVIQKFGQQVDCYFSCAEYLEIVPKGVNKGNAITWMCRKLGIDIADSIACGDADNDLTMIRTAGIGVAMANGTDEAKTAANYITEHDNNHDGIAEVVEKFLLS